MHLCRCVAHGPAGGFCSSPPFCQSLRAVHLTCRPAPLPFPLCQPQEVPEGGLGTAGSPESLLPHNLQPQQLSRAPAQGDRIGLEGVYHMQAISILEESIIR